MLEMVRRLYEECGSVQGVLKYLDIELIQADLDEPRALLVEIDTKWYLVCHMDAPSVRILHLIGHYLLHRSDYTEFIEPKDADSATEAEANTFADTWLCLSAT